MTLSKQEPSQVGDGREAAHPILAPLIVGEVLFDCFPDGSRVLGGAPFNVAWNLQGLGLHPVFVSAVGDDADGRVVRQAMLDWNMELAGLQTCSLAPTGRVEVTLENGQPSYEILADQAYDHIARPQFETDANRFSLLYVGSLAYRSGASRKTIDSLIGSNLPRFVDINIRQPWFDRHWVSALFSGAQWVKLNEDELSWITDLPCETSPQIERAVQALKAEYDISTCVITRGSAGACLYTGEQFHHQAAPQPPHFKDTVGAGDAFASATILGICYGRPLLEAIGFAAQFASQTCGLQGGTTNDPEHYQRFLATLPFRTASATSH